MAEHDADPAIDRNSPEIIEPIKYRPTSNAPQLPRVRVPWAHLFIGALVVMGSWGAWYVMTARSVSIETTPAQAQVTADELVAPKMSDHWLLRPGKRKFIVEAPGYKRFSDAIEITNEAIQSHTVNLDPLPGLLTVSVSPVDSAEITIDEGVAATVPATIEDIEAGPREIVVTAPRYLPFKTVIEIEGRAIEQKLDVSLSPAWADISISSEPAAAVISIDAEEIGITPLTPEVLQGNREISLRLDGYKPWRRKLLVVAGSQIELPPIILAKEDGFLRINTTPSGASITVDKKYKGQSPVKVAVVPDKKHQISVLKEGYAGAARSASVASGQTEELNLALKPQLAAVQVIATPADAQLYINGEAKGDANQIIKLPTHSHEIEIRKSGYVSFKTNVTPRQGIRKQIKVRLKTPAEASKSKSGAAANAAKKAASKGVVVTAVGQTLKLFRGGDVKMGSSRREPGRRANEVLREIKLTRPFYFGLKEVSNGEFRQFLANHSVAPIKGTDVNGDKFPVINASWESAALFCNWLSRKDSLPVFYQIKNRRVLGVNPAATGYRLPTEAEWAFVARSTPKSTEPFKFPWAGSFPPRGRSGNYADQSAGGILGQVLPDYTDGFAATAPVGSFPASLFGIYDLGGNVSEWINDYYAASVSQRDTEFDPLGPRSGDAHVIRGSNWAQASESELRLAYRDFGKEGRDDVGFRIARYAQ